MSEKQPKTQLELLKLPKYKAPKLQKFGALRSLIRGEGTENRFDLAGFPVSACVVPNGQFQPTDPECNP